MERRTFLAALAAILTSPVTKLVTEQPLAFHRDAFSMVYDVHPDYIYNHIQYRYPKPIIIEWEEVTDAIEYRIYRGGSHELCVLLRSTDLAVDANSVALWCNGNDPNQLDRP